MAEKKAKKNAKKEEKPKKSELPPIGGASLPAL